MLPGEDLKKMTHYYKDPHYYSNQKVAVIGESNSSVDAASECYRKRSGIIPYYSWTRVGQNV